MKVSKSMVERERKPRRAQRDIRDIPEYQEAEALYRTIWQPGSGQMSDAMDIHACADGLRAVFAGAIVEALAGTRTTRVAEVDLGSGELRVLTQGPRSDRLPKYSPDGKRVAFLSDRQKEGDFQLYLLDPHSTAVRSTPAVQGWVEYFHWSPDGSRILLGVAGHGADVAGGQGAIPTEQLGDNRPSWMPTVRDEDEPFRWRSVWVYEVAADRVHRVSGSTVNVWEAAWCGNAAVAAILSPGPSEGLWYCARLAILDIHTGESREVYRPEDQLGWPASSPSGRFLSVVEAVCSDRWSVAGDLLVIETRDGEIRRVDTHDVNITWAEWRAEGCLLLAGHRGFDSVVGRYDSETGKFTELWRSSEITTGGRFISLAAFGDSGSCAMVAENYLRAPEIGVIHDGEYHAVRSFDVGYATRTQAIRPAERVNWVAPDGLELEGWLLRPGTPGPHPLVMAIHGGPVWHWRPVWLGREGIWALMLLERGYAVFFPNPRGSAGRGQAFARLVVGDMGGADAGDLISGVETLVSRGVADPKRLGVTGRSYGGFMSAWLITQDQRFAAAVPVAPVINHVTEQLLSNIPEFTALFLQDSYTRSGGKYFERSPVMHAHKARTPTLTICGVLDRCTPPSEAEQFHQALRENGVRSVLVSYPQEGHGIQKLPAVIDYAARLVTWFVHHMPPGPRPGQEVVS